MNREEFLRRVQNTSGLTSIHQADEVVRAVVSVLKAVLPSEQAEMIASALPPDLREGWRLVDEYPADILEKEDIYYDGAETMAEEEAPTITQG